jgi:hypothetical protein
VFVKTKSIFSIDNQSATTQPGTMAFFGVLICAILLAVGGFYQVFKPRLPQYTFQIQSFVPKFLSSNAKLAYQLTSDIQMHNDNFIAIHIYALSFDLFYPDWQQRLHHVGQVTDSRQQEEPDRDFDTPLWVLPPRQNFQMTDDVIMIPNGGAMVMSSLSWDALSKGGILQIPLSGVIHIKADGKIPVTMGMICDNLLNIWKLQVQGLSCQIASLEPGWSDLDLVGERLRQRIENVLWNPCDHPQEQDLVNDEETCGIAEGYSISRMQQRRKVEWNDALPILAI